ncbi:hypothetical protein D7Y41_35150 [Anaerotruncus sp. 1XD22-93]|nr:hypothetical protein D7Y41_35150 [Anaerotruncus sp. 1XD22-93]
MVAVLNCMRHMTEAFLLRILSIFVGLSQNFRLLCIISVIVTVNIVTFFTTRKVLKRTVLESLVMLIIIDLMFVVIMLFQLALLLLVRI